MRIKHFVSLLRVGIKPAGWETEVGKCPVSGDLEEKRRNSALLLGWRKDNHGWKEKVYTRTHRDMGNISSCICKYSALPYIS